MQPVKICVVADSHKFGHPLLTLQAGKVKVWVRVDQRSLRAISVKVEHDADVYDTMKAATVGPQLQSSFGPGDCDIQEERIGF